jgi:cilia- and flagella-associated protein 52
LFLPGLVPDGLKVHPDGKHIIYPVGCTVVIENISTKKQEFLSGHSNNISCLAVSKSGRFIASGQVTYMGFKVISCHFIDIAVK